MRTRIRVRGVFRLAVIQIAPGGVYWCPATDSCYTRDSLTRYHEIVESADLSNPEIQDENLITSFNIFHDSYSARYRDRLFLCFVLCALIIWSLAAVLYWMCSSVGTVGCILAGLLTAVASISVLVAELPVVMLLVNGNLQDTAGTVINWRTGETTMEGVPTLLLLESEERKG